MTASSTPNLTVPPDDDDHILGPADAPVTVVEYADFECLHCARAHPILKQLRDELPDAFRLVFRHFPLVADHPRSVAAARAAVAAGRQGKFWEMHDLLLEHPAHLHADAFRLHAEDLGLDLARFDRDLDDPLTSARIERDIVSGRASGVRGTPTFFIDGVRYGAGWDLDALRSAILAAVGSSVRSLSEHSLNERTGPAGRGTRLTSSEVEISAL